MMTRTAYFLDLDNLAGSGRPSKEQIEEVLKSFEAEFQPERSDQVFCCGTHTSAMWAGFARPGYVTRSGVGRDGADRRILEMADPSFLATRFQKVVIGSGDGAFAELVEELRANGLEVELMTGRGRIHQKLYKSVAPIRQGDKTPRRCLALAA